MINYFLQLGRFDLIIQNRIMQSKGKNFEQLKLQSYKVDNQVLVSKINELNELKSELESTLSKHRSQENSIQDELERLRAQNQKLRAIVSDLEFTKKSQTYLIQQLEKRLQVAQNKALSLSQRLDQEERDKGSLKQFYEKKIDLLNDSIQQINAFKKPKIFETSKVVEYQADDSPNPPFNFSNKSISSIDESSKCESAKKIKKLKKPSIQQPRAARISQELSNKYLTPNVILENEQDSHLSGEDVYFEMIRHLYKQLLKIEINSSQLLKIPQIEAFSRLKNPSKNDLAKLFKSYPFHIGESHKIDLIFQFISKQAERLGMSLNGRFIVESIIQQIQEINCSQDIRPEDDISSFEMDSPLKVEGRTGVSKNNKQRRYSNVPHSITDSGISNDSDNSNFY